MNTRPLDTLLPASGRSGFAPYPAPTRKGNPVVALFLTWNARYRMRCHLADLPEHMLADIGLTRADADREIAKPIWRK